MAEKHKEAKTENQKDKYKHGELRQIILGAIGLGIIAGGVMITPNFPIVLGSIIGLVKEFIKIESQACICPPRMLICTCGHQSTLKIITRKVIRPGRPEIENNPRSRSARMRVAERI